MKKKRQGRKRLKSTDQRVRIFNSNHAPTLEREINEWIVAEGPREIEGNITATPSLKVATNPLKEVAGRDEIYAFVVYTPPGRITVT